MRVPRRATLAFALATALAVALPPLASAATVQDLVARASDANVYGMTCRQGATEWDCTRAGNNLTPAWEAVITPISGQEDTLTTHAYTGVSPLDSFSQAWMADMHQLACGDKAGVTKFVSDVGALTAKGTITRDIGTCHFTGGFTGPATVAPAEYSILSTYVPPPPPTPTPKPTAKPTPKPTAKPTPTPAPSPSPSPSPSPTATAVATASPPPTIAPTPTAFVDAVAASPAPTVAGGGTGGGAPQPTPPEFFQSVLGITDVNTGPQELGGSLVLALLMLLIIGFAGELFNNTVENNYDEISGWFKKGVLARLRRFGGRLGNARVGLLLFLGITALVSSFVDPHFGFDLRSLGEFLGFLVGLVVVLASFKLPPMLTHKRKTGDLGRLRPLPWALVIAALFVLVSRLGNLQPGYLYGLVLGAIFVKDVSDREEGRETFYGSLWTLSAAVLAWIALTWLRGLGYDPHGFGITLLSTAFAAILVSGLEATAFGLMPLRFMPGFAVYKWNRLGWAILFGLAIFGFLHILIGPTSGYVSSLTPKAFVAALGVFAAFGALSIGTWAYFRFRTASAEEVLEERLER